MPHDADAKAGCESPFNTSCKEPYFGSHSGKRFCVLHFPGPDKSTAFHETLTRKIRDRECDFSGVWFNERVVIERHTFSSDAQFRGAVFPGGASFRYSTFEQKADFRGAVFLGDADFHGVVFKDNVSFREARLRNVDFSHATFANWVRFVGDGKDNWVFDPSASLRLDFARIDRPDRVSFHTVMLRPLWFVSVDIREFDLADIWWVFDLKGEVMALKQKRRYPNVILSIVYRQLAVNSEVAHYYAHAGIFRYCAMELRTWRDSFEDGIRHYTLKELWGLVKREITTPRLWRSFPARSAAWSLHGILNFKLRALVSLSWWYWLMSGYGERVRRAAIALAVVILGFAGVYTLIGVNDSGQSYQFLRNTIYSCEITLLQTPEPRPKPDELLHRMVLAGERVIGPLQVALVALAVRRQFMR